MADIFKDETGRRLRVNAGFNMSSYTELSIIFTDPEGTATTKTTSDGVTLGTTVVTDADLGSLAANEYVYYDIESGLLSKSGRWCVQVLYTNTTANPDDNLYGKIARFTVKDRC